MSVQHYVMGSNYPGYLPDGEPTAFDEYAEALDAMADDMTLFADEWDECVDYREEDYRTMAAKVRDGSVTDEFGALLGFNVIPSTDNRVWWITPCAEDREDCGHFTE